MNQTCRPTLANSAGSPNQVARLRAIPLELVLEMAGAQRDPHDKHKWHTHEGVLSVTGVKFMNWTHDKGGGGAIDLAMGHGLSKSVQTIYPRKPTPNLSQTVRVVYYSVYSRVDVAAVRVL